MLKMKVRHRTIQNQKFFDHNAEKYVSFFTFINTLSEDEIKHLIKVMKNEGIGDSYALEEVKKLW